MPESTSSYARKLLSNLAGVGEVGLMMGTGLGTEVAGGIAGLASLPFGGAQGAGNVIDRIQNYTYQPRGSAAQRWLQTAAPHIKRVADYWRDEAIEFEQNTGFPREATMALPLVSAELAGGGLALKGARQVLRSDKLFTDEIPKQIKKGKKLSKEITDLSEEIRKKNASDREWLKQMNKETGQMFKRWEEARKRIEGKMSNVRKRQQIIREIDELSPEEWKKMYEDMPQEDKDFFNEQGITVVDHQGIPMQRVMGENVIEGPWKDSPILKDKQRISNEIDDIQLMKNKQYNRAVDDAKAEINEFTETWNIFYGMPDDVGGTIKNKVGSVIREKVNLDNHPDIRDNYIKNNSKLTALDRQIDTAKNKGADIKILENKKDKLLGDIWEQEVNIMANEKASGRMDLTDFLQRPVDPFQ